MARQKSRSSQLIVIERDGAIDHRRALPPNERRLRFGERWNYAPAPETSDYIQLQSRYQLFIDGKFVKPRSGKYFASINPATEEKLAEIAEANARDVDLAVKSARRAYEKRGAKCPDASAENFSTASRG